MRHLHPNSCLRRDPARERLFASKLVKNGFDRVQAVIDAGITTNRNSAHVIGYRLLRRVTTQLAIKEHMEESKMSADEVLERLTKVARTEVDLKGSDVVKANELLGKFHKLFVERIESNNTNTTSIDPSALSRSISKISSKTGQSKREIALEFQQEFSDKDDPDYNPDLEVAIGQVIANMAVSEPVAEQISEISGEQ